MSLVLLLFLCGDEILSFSFFLLFDSFRLARTRTEILFDTNAGKIREIFIPIIRFILHVFVIGCNLTFT